MGPSGLLGEEELSSGTSSASNGLTPVLDGRALCGHVLERLLSPGVWALEAHC